MRMSVTLETPFLYQNRSTGQPSTSPLSVRQLCRILCPVSGSSAATIITPQTQLLGYDPDAQNWGEWKVASAVDILKEACMTWYYAGDDGAKGPVSLRQLREIILDDSQSVSAETRVYPATPATGGNEWKRINEIQNLQLALEAITESTSMPSSWPADGGNEKDDSQINSTDEQGGDEPDVPQQTINEELEAFLKSTDGLATHADRKADESDEEEYESDGGTRYIRDSSTGQFVHEDLAPKKDGPKEERKPNISQSSAIATIAAGKKRKRNKAKFSAKNARNWVYVTGLPQDTNEDEVAKYFSKVGILDLDPETQKPKVKLYRMKNGDGNKPGLLKGDASVCYARPESVELALQILDDNLYRDGATLTVQRAKFEQQGSFDHRSTGGRRIVSEAKRKVARIAALQAVGWDEGENGRIAGGLKGLRIIVLTNMFDPKDLEKDTNDEKLRSIEKSVRAECDELGDVEKITVFSKHPAGVMVVKFSQPNAASAAVDRFKGRDGCCGRKIEASYWDGVTDYTAHNAEQEERENEKRLDQFGDWLENQELPEEFKLQVES